MDLFHKLIDLIDKNSNNIPEGDYLEMCNTIQQLRQKVQPPYFLLDQNEPMPLSQMTDGTYGAEGPPPHTPVYVPTMTRIARDDEVTYPGLTDFLNQLEAEWAATDNGNVEEDSDEDETISWYPSVEISAHHR